MAQEILFIQGGGEGGYEADKELVASLKTALGKGYEINYPKITTDDSSPDFGWVKEIENIISGAGKNIFVIAHSFGASMVLKYLTEKHSSKNIRAVFLLATPFWTGDEDWIDGLKLQEDFDKKLPPDIPIFFYHCKDDEEVLPFHFEMYRKKVTHATFRLIDSGGHQFNDHVATVAIDIKSLQMNNWF